MHPTSNNIGAYIASRLALDPTSFGAGFGNIAEQHGVSIDRTAVRPLHLSGKLQLGYKGTLASGHTVSFTYALQDSSDDASFDDVENASGVTSITGVAGVTPRGVMTLDVNLQGVKQYMRCRVTPVMSHSGTDVISVAGVYALGGGETIPPTESDN